MAFALSVERGSSTDIHLEWALLYCDIFMVYNEGSYNGVFSVEGSCNGADAVARSC